MPRDHARPATDHDDPNGRDRADPTPPARAPTHAERCRTLAAEARSATLCSVARGPVEGYPYASLVTVAIDDKGRPLLLLSQLAEHTQNLLHRADASILLTEPLGRHAQPLALGRVTLIGPCRLVGGDEVAGVRATFLAAQPDSSYYVDFKDFAFYRLDPVALRYVGGFGRMSWVTADDYAVAEPDPLVSSAADILAHMNSDHADAVLAYARAFARLLDATAATMTAVDRYGFDLGVTTPAGPRAARVAFDAPVATSDEVRRAMVAMVKAARATLA